MAVNIRVQWKNFLTDILHIKNQNLISIMCLYIVNKNICGKKVWDVVLLLDSTKSIFNAVFGVGMWSSPEKGDILKKTCRLFACILYNAEVHEESLSSC